MKRRHFLKHSSAGLLTILGVQQVIAQKKYVPKLAFSTLGCPEWSFEKILESAVQNGYQGIELRGIQKDMDLTVSPLFNSPSNIQNTLKLCKKAGISIVDLGSSTNLHWADATKRKSNLDEAKRFIDLAATLNCPYIRVFPNDFPKEQSREQTLQAMIENLVSLGEYAKNTSVKVLLETHGQLVYVADILHVIQTANHPQVGLIWDFYNMWSVTKESPSEVYAQLAPYIKHVHLKDAITENGKEKYVLFGEGTAPVQEVLQLLKKGNYQGYYSFEWEKRWHPEIQEPEIAIPHFSKAIIKKLKDA